MTIVRRRNKCRRSIDAFHDATKAFAGRVAAEFMLFAADTIARRVGVADKFMPRRRASMFGVTSGSRISLL